MSVVCALAGRVRRDAAPWLAACLLSCSLPSARSAPTTICASVAAYPAATPANERSEMPSISADGRFVAFVSIASNLVPGDSSRTGGVFVLDRQTGQMERVSVTSAGEAADGANGEPSISADGRFVAFWSQSTSLAAGDTPGYDVYVRDMDLRQTERIPVEHIPGQRFSYALLSLLSLSEDGRYVAFTADGNGLVPDDANGADDVFVFDRETRRITRVSLTADGAPARHASYDPSLSADGTYVAFTSEFAMAPGGAGVSPGVYLRGPIAYPVIPPYTWAEVAAALKIAGGLALPEDMDRLNVVDAYAGRLNILDAARLARKAAGLEPNP